MMKLRLHALHCPMGARLPEPRSHAQQASEGVPERPRRSRGARCDFHDDRLLPMEDAVAGANGTHHAT